MKKSFTGAITALVTPFEKSGKIDIFTLKKLVKFQIENGISGIVVAGSTGEAATMDVKEYELVVKTVVKIAKGLIPIIAGAGSNDTKKAIHLSQIAKKAGADALLHVTPYYNKPSPAGLLAHYREIAKAVKMPIILYNVPGRTGLNVLPNTVLAIAKEVPLVIGIKEASGNVAQIGELIQKAAPTFIVLSGDDALTLPIMAMGGHGCISVVANQKPKEFSELVKVAQAGDFARAKELHYQLLDLMNVNFIETNPVPVKTSLAIMGMIKEVFRLPLAPLTMKNREVLISVLKKQRLL